MKIMPFFLPVISIGLPAGLVLYFAVSNTYRVAQQWFIGRSIYGPAEAEQKVGRPTGPSRERGPRAGGGATQPPKPKQGRMAAAMSAAAAKADGQGGPGQRGGAEPTGQAARPDGHDARPSRAPTDAASKPTPDQERPARRRRPGGPRRRRSDQQGRPARPTARPSRPMTPAPTKPVLQPRARKKKE